MKEKIIISGDIIEIIGYSKLNTDTQDMKEVRAGSGKLKLENYVRRQKQRRDMIRRLVTANFKKEYAKFHTLTFAKNMTDLKMANSLFKAYIRRLRIKYGKFSYIAVIEFQKRGAIHYHLLSDLPYIPADELSMMWGQGFIKVNAVEHVDNLGAYLVKYMTKDNADDRLQGEMGYLISKGLNRPVVIQSWKDGNDIIGSVVQKYGLDKKKPTYEATYESEHNGKTRYLQYNLSRQSLKNQ